jgi:hypothetical protein
VTDSFSFKKPDYRQIGTAMAEGNPNGYLYQETAEDIIERGKEAQRIAKEREQTDRSDDTDE